jgi:ferredoxin
MVNNKKTFCLFGVAILALVSLSGCVKQGTAINPADEPDEQEIKASTDSQSKQLAITPRCVGCGHCVRFDSEHFRMNSQSRLAEVISQSNLASSRLSRAITRCPVGAISIGD